ncbi:MAG: hypothetical protein KDK05_18060 [Candidatus Competibacteraceae bacterium]|nr:hypothetical protein [Candidatus Competibacteraceae bacterium]
MSKDFLEESQEKLTGKAAFRQMANKVDKKTVEAATVEEKKDKRKKRGRTIRFEPHDADEVFRLVKEWGAYLAEEKGKQIGAKLEPFTDNDVFVWCIKRGLQALDEGERPQSVVSGSLIL